MRRQALEVAVNSEDPARTRVVYAAGGDIASPVYVHRSRVDSQSLLDRVRQSARIVTALDG
jgi:hypothetical protein